MKLYTRTGDDGTTGMPGGRRVAKNDGRIVAFGEVDETNALIGLAAARCKDDHLVATLRKIQSDLFVLGANLAGAQADKQDVAIGESHVLQLEGWIDVACEQTPPLNCFVLPGGSEMAAALHVARAVCRRAERAAVALAQTESVEQAVLLYLNRLSDLLFALARQANHVEGVPDIPWILPALEKGS